MMEVRLTHRALIIGIAVLSSSAVITSGCGPKSGTVLDEAMRAGRAADSFPAADEDYFRDMDRGLSKDRRAVAAALPFLSEAAAVDAFVKGRNNWIVWTGGNDRLWDYLANHSFGSLDFLKTLSSHPTQRAKRQNRWYELGLVNEPCFEQATGPNPNRYGLWLDRRIGTPECPPDPFENATRYPGARIGARGRNIPVGSYYGEASGIVGLRLFPNPDFDERAQARWDPVRFYEDPTYYQDRDLVRPYRVGMSCAFCHVGPSPINPPADYENPRWENLHSNPGAQYFWWDRIFFWDDRDRERNFVYQVLHTSLPGTLDTSLVSSDNINNPRTMNAVYSVGPRLDLAPRWGKEKLGAGGLRNRQFNDFERTKVLSALFQPPDTVWTPRVLKDGADSVGTIGALNRVYINIGLFSEEWLTHFIPLLGGKITPIELEVLQKNSAYWQATEQQTPDLALFFLASARPDYLKDAPGGDASLTKDEQQLTRGKVVFAENCARCHSSKQPPNLCVSGTPCGPGDIMENSGPYFEWMRTEVQKPDFLEANYLSTDRRIPVTELGTNACSPLATNAIRGDIWDNFSAESYKTLPAVGTITVHHPTTGAPREYEMPGEGRGYTRVPSLISVWSTAPFLLNNSVGEFDYRGTVEGRMRSFNDAIQQMLWPEKRKRDDQMVRELGLPDNIGLSNVPGYIQRTTHTSYLRLASGYFPAPFDVLNDKEIGPIPKGTPISLLANIAPIREGSTLVDRRLLPLALKLIAGLKAIPADLDEAERDLRAREVFEELVPELLELSKCPDFVVNRGHYFGSNLGDDDKWALIEFLKTL
jgi:hypothetical protein